MIYLDYNATALLRPEVVARMAELLGESLNASSVHTQGRRARGLVEASRKTIAAAINCFPDELVFCGSGTEANNWALQGAVSSQRLIVSAIEHASVLKAAVSGQRSVVSVTKEGVLDLQVLEDLLTTDRRPLTTLISTMLANNETGVIQPIQEVVAIAKKHGALVHCDAVQALGKIPLDFSSLGVDMMTVSAHKMGGPVGAAALIIRRGLEISPFLKGGGQESNRRAGTENVAAIAGFAEAVSRIDLAYMERVGGWLRDAEMQVSGVKGFAFDTCTLKPAILGISTPRLPNTSCIAMPGVSAETQLIAFDLEKIAVSAGSACTSGKIEPSHVIQAMGYSHEVAATAIRVSGGFNTTENDIKAFAEVWKKLYQRIHSSTVSK